MLTEEIRAELFRLRDEKYRDFQCRLLPTVEPDAIIGVRTPALRACAKELLKRGDVSGFLNDLPHRFFDEDQLHAFIVSGIRDYERCLEEVCRFLPYVNNWATCDQMSPKVFKKHRSELLEHIRAWIGSSHTYSVRFGVGMLMEHFLDEDFDPSYPDMVAGIRSEEYYVKMMTAWYFATALAKRFDAVIPYFEDRRLEPWMHNKAIRKAVESFRVREDQKQYLKSLRIR